MNAGRQGSAAVAIRHVAFEDLGSFEAVLAERGIWLTYLDAARDDLARRVAELDPYLLVVLGGPVGAYEQDSYPFLAVELALIRQRIARRRPLLGICLGAQLIAAALGCRVYPSGVKEIGWAPVEHSPAGAGSPLGELTGPVLHWHGDTFDLPAGSVHLASTPACRNQAFAIGTTTLGLQFHPEVLADAVESWLVGHAHELAHAPGVTVGQVRADTRRYAAALERQGPALFRRWLDALVTAGPDP